MSTELFRVLTVCTANICRSPAAARLLQLRFERTGQLTAADYVIASAGTHAINGAPACDLSSALVGSFVARTYAVADPSASGTHRSQRVTRELARASDLILTMDREHRAVLAQIAPQTRQRTFTIRQAAPLAEGIAQGVAQGRLPEGAAPLPGPPFARLKWLVAEMDAMRGITHLPDTIEREPAGDLSWHALDIPDPHVMGYQIHPMAIERIEAAVVTLCDAIDVLLTQPAPDGSRIRT